MFLTKKVIIGLALGSFIISGQASARQTVLTGSLELEQNYDSNVFQTDRDRTDEWNSVVSPGLSLASLGQYDQITLSYTPKFSYNHRRYTDEMVHDLALDAERALSPNWKVTMNDAYTYSDNAVFEADASLTLDRQFQRADAFTQAEIVRLLFPEITWTPEQLPFVLSQLSRRHTEAAGAVQSTVNGLLQLTGGNDGRQRYFSNDLSFSSVYEFARDSQLTFTYAINVLDNKTGVQADSVEQNPGVALSYRFNPRWSLEAAYDFSKTNYDTSDDSTTNNPSIQVEYNLTDKNKLTSAYDYENISYDGTTGDSTSQSLTMGWDRTLTEFSNLTTSLDFSYNKRELASDERELILNLGWDRRYDRGNISLAGDGSWAESSEAGSWNDLRRSWKVQSDASYDMRSDLSSTVRGSYEKRYAWDTINKTTYDDFALGGSLTYKISRWFSLSLDYDFKLFNTDSASLDDYKEHLIVLKLSAAKELWRR